MLQKMHVFFFRELHFCSTESMDSLNLKRHNFFQNKNNGKATHRPLIFKLPQEVP